MVVALNPVVFQSATKMNETELKTTNSKIPDPYDLDIEIVITASDKGNTTPEGHGLITSKSLCTPGCGNTGTYNSYCC